MDELLSRARQGDLEALALLLQHPRLIAAVRATLRPFCVDTGTTEDLVQELFVRMARLVVQKRFPDATNERQLCVWVATTVRNLAIDATRRQPEPERVLAELERVRALNGHTAQQGEDLARLHEALARLDEQDRRLIVARYLHGQTFDEIAAWAGTHRHDASALVTAARDRLARELERRATPERVRPPIPLSTPEPEREAGGEERRVITEDGA